MRRVLLLVASAGVACVVPGSGALLAQVGNIQFEKCPPPPYGTTFCPNAPLTVCQGTPINCSNTTGQCPNNPQTAYKSWSQGNPVVANSCQYTGNPNDFCNQKGQTCQTFYFAFQCCYDTLVCQNPNYFLYCQ